MHPNRSKPTTKPCKKQSRTRPNTRVAATVKASRAGVCVTSLTLRLSKRVDRAGYALLSAAQVELAQLWNAAVSNSAVINGPRDRGYVYAQACKGVGSHTTGDTRGHLANDVLAAFKSFDAKVKRGDTPNLPGECTQGWRRATWNTNTVNRVVRLHKDSIELCLGRGKWVSIDLSGPENARWRDVSKRCFQVAVDRDVANELVLRVTCTPEEHESNVTQTRIRQDVPATAAVDPGVRNWTVVVQDDHGCSRAHVLPATLLQAARAKRTRATKASQRAKADRAVADAERKMARALTNLLKDEGVVHLVVGTSNLNGWARTPVLNRLYANAAQADIAVTLVDEKNTSRTCPKCDKTTVQAQYGAWHCSACGFSRTHDAGRDVVAATLLLRTQMQDAAVPTKQNTFTHVASNNATQLSPVIPCASQQPRGSVPVVSNGTLKPGTDTRTVHRKVTIGQRHTKGRSHVLKMYTAGSSAAILHANQTLPKVGFGPVGRWNRCV